VKRFARDSLNLMRHAHPSTDRRGHWPAADVPQTIGALGGHVQATDAVHSGSATEGEDARRLAHEALAMAGKRH